MMWDQYKTYSETMDKQDDEIEILASQYNEIYNEYAKTEINLSNVKVGIKNQESEMQTLEKQSKKELFEIELQEQ